MESEVYFLAILEIPFLFLLNILRRWRRRRRLARGVELASLDGSKWNQGGGGRRRRRRSSIRRQRQSDPISGGANNTWKRRFFVFHPVDLIRHQVRESLSVGRFLCYGQGKTKKKNGRVLFCCCCFFWLLCYSRTSCSGLLLLRRLRYSWSRGGFLIDGVVIWLAGLTPLIRRRRHPRRSQSKRLSAVPRRCNPRRGSKASILENSTETISFLFFLLKTIQKAGRFS